MAREDLDLVSATAECHSISAEDAAKSSEDDLLRHKPTPAANLQHCLSTALHNLRTIIRITPWQIRFGRDGSDTIMQNNRHRLEQAYATKYSKRKIPRFSRLVRNYSFPFFLWRKRLRLINKMTSLLDNIKLPKLYIPRDVNDYSWLFNKYVNQVKGAQGEAMAERNLRHHGYHPAHNVNIKFNYAKYYAYLYNKYHTESFRRQYESSRKEAKSRNNNQIDLLYINHYGIFIFEVKNYSHNKIWINKAGQIAWLKPKHKKYPGPPHQDDDEPSINQQMKLHNAAVWSLLRSSNARFSPKEQRTIYENTFDILVYVKKIKHHRILGGTYRYDPSVRDHSHKFNIYPFDQFHCANAISRVSKQFSFDDSLLKRLKDSIYPQAERNFTLPVFERRDVPTLNAIIKIKKELNYIFKLLRHACYRRGVLNRVIPEDSFAYRHFMYERYHHQQLLHYWHKESKYWYYSHSQHCWLRAKHLRSFKVKKYHSLALDKYRSQINHYNEFYK